MARSTSVNQQTPVRIANTAAGIHTERRAARAPIFLAIWIIGAQAGEGKKRGAGAGAANEAVDVGRRRNGAGPVFSGITPGCLVCGSYLELLFERHVKIIDIVEIDERVGRRLSHQLAADHVENQLSEIAGAVQSPTVQHRLGQVAVPIQGVAPDCLAKLLAGDMALRALFSFGFGRRVGQRLAGPVFAHPQHLFRVGQRIE